MYMFEIYVKDKNELYLYKGDPDDLDTFPLNEYKIKNK